MKRSVKKAAPGRVGENGRPTTRARKEPRLEDRIAAIAREIPDEEWNKVPGDLSYNLDHYLHGARKR